MLKTLIDMLNTLIAYLIIFFIKIYQYFVSPILTYFFGPSCRFTPTCSQYAIQSFKNYSFPIAFYLSIKRILRCHPFNIGYEDPIPEKVEFIFLNKNFTFLSKKHQKNK